MFHSVVYNLASLQGKSAEFNLNVFLAHEVPGHVTVWMQDNTGCLRGRLGDNKAPLDTNQFDDF